MLQLGVLLTCAVLFGGGGVAYGLANLAVQLAALGLLAANREDALRCWLEQPFGFTLLVLLTLGLPLLHLVPLPTGLWQALPGRELAVEARQSFGVDGWYGLTLDSGRTLVAAIGLIAPLVVLTLALRMSHCELVKLGWLIVALGFAQFLVGVPQVLTSGQTGLFYPENPMPGILFGTFANRNSTGLFLVATILLGSLLPSRDFRWSVFRWAMVAALVIAVLLTRSRSAVVLLAIPAGLAALKYRFAYADKAQKRRTAHTIILSFIALLGIAAATLAIVPQTRLADTFQRFSQTEEARFFLWEDVGYATAKYWPAGAGMGTFDEVFQADESLEYVTPRPAGRAHNDFLELAVEAGAPGLALAIVWIALIAWFAWRARGQENRWTAWAGAAILAAIALQSLVDYPLRNQAMLCLAAFALALLYRHSQVSEERP